MYVDLGPDEQSGKPAAMIVDPAKLTQVQQGFDAEAERIQNWIAENQDALMFVGSAGGDGCSRHMASDLSKTGTSAIDAANAYIKRLQTAALKLSENAKAYQLQEEHNASNFGQEPA